MPRSPSHPLPDRKQHTLKRKLAPPRAERPHLGKIDDAVLRLDARNVDARFELDERGQVGVRRAAVQGERVDAVLVGGLHGARWVQMPLMRGHGSVDGRCLISLTQRAADLAALTCGGPRIVPFQSFMSRSSES